MSMKGLNIQHADWAIVEREARHIRTAVFIEEQGITAEDEWDDQDTIALHFMVYDEQKAIATARLLSNHSVGRVAVLSQYRGHGIGRILMQQIIAQAKIEKRPRLKLSAQVHAIHFYESLGFAVQGSEYLDCGIPHVDMTMILDTSH